MMDALARKLGLKTDSTIFFSSAGIMILFLVVILIAPGPIGAAFGAEPKWVVTNLGWLFIFGVTSWVAVLLWLSSNIKERQLAGIKRAKAEGRALRSGKTINDEDVALY